VVYGLKQCRQYLLGRKFVVRTDHTALSWLRRTPEPIPLLARWLTFIEEFSFDVQHRVGTKHLNVDSLSRMPICDEASLETLRSIRNFVSRQLPSKRTLTNLLATP